MPSALYETMTDRLTTKAFFDAPTFTLTYVIWDQHTKDAVIIDPVLNYEAGASQTSTESIDELSHFVEVNQLKVHWILETHAHADHISGAQLLKERFMAPIGIGENIKQVQATFKELFNLSSDFEVDGTQFDKLIKDEEKLQAGSFVIEAIFTPGHTPACMSYKIENIVFTGDALFMSDYGTGRTDFPGGSASELYESIHSKLYKLPDDTRVFVGHDYLPNGRELCFETTIGESKALNPQLKDTTTAEEFIRFRTQRDATLSAPKLLFPSVQVNINAGRLPKAQSNGKRYMSIPLNLFGPTDDIGNPILGNGESNG